MQIGRREGLLGSGGRGKEWRLRSLRDAVSRVDVVADVPEEIADAQERAAHASLLSLSLSSSTGGASKPSRRSLSRSPPFFLSLSFVSFSLLVRALDGAMMAAAADPHAAKQPSPHPLPRPAFPIPAKWGHRRPPHNRPDARRSAASLPGDRIPPPAPDSSPPAALLSSLALPQGKPVHTVAKCSGGGGAGAGAGGGGDEDAWLEELRAKLIREAADRIGAVPVTPAEKPSARPSPPPEAAAEAAAAAASTTPWNLRSRRRSGPAPGALPVAPATMPAADRSQRTPRMRPAAETATAVEEKKSPWPKISITLTQEEIEEDIYSLTGSRPRRRPKKRPRAVQRQLDSMYPGLWLPEIIPESYKVEEES